MHRGPYESRGGEGAGLREGAAREGDSPSLEGGVGGVVPDEGDRGQRWNQA